MFRATEVTADGAFFWGKESCDRSRRFPLPAPSTEPGTRGW